MLNVFIFNCQTTINKSITHHTPEEFQSFLTNDSIQLIDVRKPSEYSVGHISNAVNINFLSENFISNINKLNKEKPVYIYCHSGMRSAKSAIQFKKAGFVKIYELEGGIVNWEARGLKTTTE
ncbi:rhodanese-like domain-containing protein [Flaviramulus aquimarinus]|uniref:Rhodanese-like domain-containing protein n=1 Tax=Flaviramulus aquimarinus TaxID=1170456 RepID=A0ABP9F1L5_9FLAO